LIIDNHGSYVIFETIKQLTTKFGLDMVTLFCIFHTPSSPWMCPISNHSKQHLEGLVLQWKLKNKSGHIVDFLNQQGTTNFHSFVNYHSTFSSSTIIILFWKCQIFWRLFVQKLRKFKGEKNTKFCENPWVYCFRPIQHCIKSIQ
jgi:hypothetical protein